MRIILPFLFILLQSQLLSAQVSLQDTVKKDTSTFSVDQTRRRRAPESENHKLKMQNYSLQIEVKELELEKLSSDYKDASKARKKGLIVEIQNKLYELFDLDLKQKEEEASMLDLQLIKLKEDNTYQKKSDEIQALQKVLDEVRNSLKFRRENKDRFVQQRLKKVINL